MTVHTSRASHGLGAFGDTLLRGVASANETSISLRRFATSKHFCALDPSPLARAIMDAACGLPVTTIDDVAALKHFGCALAQIPRHAPKSVAVRAGRGGGKSSQLLAPKILHAAWTVPVPDLARGEEAFALIVAPTLDGAGQTFAFVRGIVEGSPKLRAALVGDPLAESLRLRRPDGRVCCIRTFAATRGGTNLRSRTLVGVAFDEAAFFRDHTSVVNDKELFRAVLPRLVPGAQVWLATTPWIAGVGVVEEEFARDYGKHESTLCVTAPTRALRPSWDLDGSLERAMRADDPDMTEREIDAVPLPAGSAQFFAPAAIDAAIDRDRPVDLPPAEGVIYGAGGDAGFRRNSSTLAIAGREGARVRLALMRELKPEPGVPLQPAVVVATYAREMQRYGCTAWTVDSHEREAIRLELARHSMDARNAPEGQTGKAEMFILTRKLLHEGRLDLPNLPRLARQLSDVVAKPMPGGGLSIQSPHSRDGSHGDLVSALVAAVWDVASDDVRADTMVGYDTAATIPDHY